jgi:hypothetical protein
VVAPPGIINADADCHVLEEIGVAVLAGGVRGQVEDELVLPGSELAAQQGGHAPVVISLDLGDELGPAVFLEAKQGHWQARSRLSQLEVEHVRRDGGTRLGHCYPPRMGDLLIGVGDLHFTARWEADAPQTVAAVRGLLPIHSRLIHCRWSGEGTWIPFGALDVGVGYEHHTSHPAPGQLLIYTGSLSECEILFPYGACMFSSKLGQLAGNHFATVVEGAEQLVEMGRRCLWDGAQQIEITEGAP